MGKLHYEGRDSDACNEFPDTILNRTEDVSPFFVAERGTCSFVQKVRNMENVGVAVAIVIDNSLEMIDDILMSDDGTGNGIRIPSMLIGKKDGDKIVNWYNSASDAEKEALIVMCEFKMPVNDIVKYDFWFTSSSDRALNFLEDF